MWRWVQLYLLSQELQLDALSLKSEMLDIQSILSFGRGLGGDGGAGTEGVELFIYSLLPQPLPLTVDWPGEWKGGIMRNGSMMFLLLSVLTGPSGDFPPLRAHPPPLSLW